jgi:hypothetical protein
MCVSDWITHSFYARLRRENVVPYEKHAELDPFTALADYLIATIEKKSTKKVGVKR